MMMTTMMIPEKRIWDLVIFVVGRKKSITTEAARMLMREVF